MIILMISPLSKTIGELKPILRNSPIGYRSSNVME